MDVKTQKRLAANLLKVSPKKIIFDKDKLDDIKGAITKKDIRSLIRSKVISARKKRGVSRYRARKIIVQKRKGRKKGEGSKEGASGARLPRKKEWILAMRSQRSFIKRLKNNGLLKGPDYRIIYNKIKGGFFRSKRHIKLYLEEHKLIQDVKKKKGR